MLRLSAISRRRCARLGAATLAIVGVVSVSRFADGATWTWVGGGGNSNWNNTANWLPASIPATNAEILVQQSGAAITQNIAAGVRVASIEAPNGATISGSPIRLGSFGDLTTSGFAQADFRAPIELTGAGTIQTQSRNFFPPPYQSISVSSLTGPFGSLNIVAPDDPISPAVIAVAAASYSGTTTVRSGVLRLGGSFASLGFTTFNSAGQGNYTVLPTGTLAGQGTIGLSTGGKVTLAGGAIRPSNGGGLGLGDLDEGRLAIKGDLIFGDNSTYVCQFHDSGNTAVSSKLIVEGTLDLRGLDDRFSGRSVPPWAATYVVMEYQNRLGSFDIGGSRLIYTSAENSGPGQVILVIPEPTSTGACLLALGASTLRRRQRAR